MANFEKPIKLVTVTVKLEKKDIDFLKSKNINVSALIRAKLSEFVDEITKGESNGTKKSSSIS